MSGRVDGRHTVLVLVELNHRRVREVRRLENHQASVKRCDLKAVGTAELLHLNKVSQFCVTKPVDEKSKQERVIADMAER